MSAKPKDPSTGSEYQHDFDENLAALLDEPVFVWARANPQLVDAGIATGLASNVAYLLDGAPRDRSAVEIIQSSIGLAPHVAAALQEPDEPARPWSFLRFIEAGVPKAFCTGRNSPVENALVAVRQSRAEDPRRYLFDIEDNRWMVQNDAGAWSGSYIQAALRQMLIQEGVHPKRVPMIFAAARHVHGRRPVYGSSEQIAVLEGLDVLNTYVPPDLEPMEGDWSPYRELILNLTGGDVAGSEYVLDWLAAPIQSVRRFGRPKKMQTALVLYGVPGSGKGTLERVLSEIYGASNYVVIGQSALDARFNGEVMGKLIVIANEVISSSNRYAETSNKLKTWITDPQIPVERKYKDLAVVENGFNIIFTSNDDRPVLIERGDRRYTVFKAENKLPASTSNAIYSDLHGEKRVAAAFLAHLLQRQVKVLPGQLHETAARRDIQDESLPSDEVFARELVALGWEGVSATWRLSVLWTSGRGGPFQTRDGKRWIRSDDVMDAYRAWCTRHGKLARSSIHRALKRYIPTAEPGRPFDGYTTVRAWSGLPEGPSANDGSKADDVLSERARYEEVWLGEICKSLLN